MAIIAIVLTGCSLLSILPKIQAFFNALGEELPKLTVLVLQVSNWTCKFYYFLAIPVVGLVAFLLFGPSRATIPVSIAILVFFLLFHIVTITAVEIAFAKIVTLPTP